MIEKFGKNQSLELIDSVKNGLNRKSSNLANIEYLTEFQKDEENNKISHGLDYLTLTLTKKHTKILNRLLLGGVFINDSNTNQLYTRINTGEIFSITKSKTSNGNGFIFSITYETIPVSIFQFIIFDDVYIKHFGVSGSIKFYGGFYRLLSLKFFPQNLLDFFIHNLKGSFISRIDYRIDLFSKNKFEVPSIKTILPYLRTNKKRKPYMDGAGNMESWDCGNKKYKTTFIRFYDKNLELVKKLKGIYLYGDILKAGYKTFHRLEYQFGQKFCSGYTFEDMLPLLEKIQKSTGIGNSTFTGNLYKAKRVIDLTNELDRNRYISIFKSMANNLKDNGINPSILFDDGIKEYDTDYIVNNIKNELKIIGLDDLRVENFILSLRDTIKDNFKRLD